MKRADTVGTFGMFTVIIIVILTLWGMAANAAVAPINVNPLLTFTVGFNVVLWSVFAFTAYVLWYDYVEEDIKPLPPSVWLMVEQSRRPINRYNPYQRRF